MKIASLDLGSNSFLLLVSEVENGKIKKIYKDEQTVTRLGQGVHTNRKFHPDALSRAESCFKKYQKIIDEEDVDIVQAVSTSAARDVKNKNDFLNLGKKYSIPIQVISGDLEAELTYDGSVMGLSTEEYSVIDVGGGSTEIIGCEGGKIKGFSIDVGSVRLCEIFDGFDRISNDKLKDIDTYVLNQIEINKNKLPIVKKAMAVAGTPTTLSCILQQIEFDTKKIESYFISIDELSLMQKKLADLSLEERKQLKGAHPDRADVLPCGVSILKNICQYYSLPGFSVSCRGVRFGLALALESGKF